MNTHKILLLLSLFITGCCLAQSKSKAIKLYDAGNAAFAVKDYKTADSLFSLSLELEPHPDSYYNRAMCRRKMNDFKGYCVDLGGASNMGDKDSYNLFWKDCAKTDTLLTPKGIEKPSISNFKLAEFITTYRYNNNIEHEKYDEESSLLLSYFIKDQDTIYRDGHEIKAATFQSDDSLLFDFIKKTKFADWVQTNHMSGKIILTLIINESGKIDNIAVLRSIKNEFEDGLIKELYNLPSAKPATIADKNVKYQKVLSIIFAKNLIYPSTTEIGTKKIVKQLPLVDKSEMGKNNEVMPEFPGGPMAMMKYISKNLNYPQFAKEAGLSGKCFLRFVVNKNGAICNVDAMRGVPGCIECDVEAIKVIYSMPRWTPGMQNGKAVPVFFNLPINFNLR